MQGKMNVFKVIRSWLHLEVEDFQEMLHCLVISGAVNAPTTLIDYGCTLKRLTEGYCLMVKGAEVIPGGGLRVQAPQGMQGYLHRVRNPESSL